MATPLEAINRLERQTPIGPPIPFEQLETLSLTKHILIVNEPPFATNPQMLVVAAKGLGNIGPRDGLQELVQWSEPKNKSYLGWMAVRNIGYPEYKLTGFEPYFMGREINGKINDPGEIAKAVAAMGLRVEKTNPDLIKALLAHKIQGLSFDQLNEVDLVLGYLIRQNQREIMRIPEAGEFQRVTRYKVEAMEPWMRRIYYTRDDKGIFHQMLIIPRLDPHDALKNPEYRSHFDDEQHHGKIIMNYLARGGHPLARAGMHGQDPLG